jgi:hypothetical protein
MHPLNFLCSLSLTVLAIAICAPHSSAAIIYQTDFAGQTTGDLVWETIAGQTTGFGTWESAETYPVALVEETGDQLVMTVDGGGEPGSVQMASIRTKEVYSELNFFAQKLEVVLSGVDLSFTLTGGNPAWGVFQVGLAPVDAHSTNTGANDLIYFRIRPVTGNFSVIAIKDKIAEEIVTGTWTGDMAPLQISLVLDNKDCILSISDGVTSFSSGPVAHSLASTIWDTSMGLGIWTQSWGAETGNGPAVRASIDSMEITANPNE